MSEINHNQHCANELRKIADLIEGSEEPAAIAVAGFASGKPGSIMFAAFDNCSDGHALVGVLGRVKNRLFGGIELLEEAEAKAVEKEEPE